MGNIDSRPEGGSVNLIQVVALVEDRGRLKNIKGISVLYSSRENKPGVRYALTRSGLVCIERQPDVVWGPIEGVHVDSVAQLPLGWDEIEKKTGYTKAAVAGMFDESERHSVVNRIKEKTYQDPHPNGPDESW